MGYRSDIVIGIRPYVKAWALINDNWPSILNEADSTDEEIIASFYNYNGWKWYLSYPEVKEIHNFLSAIDEQYKDDTTSLSPYAFVRLGEENDDIETKGDPWDFGIEIHRTIQRY